MIKMKELYEKVAADNALQTKFYEIMKNAEQNGEEATGEKLISFAKDAGYDITVDEIKAFFRELADSTKGDLSEAELDMVAGGKSDRSPYVIMSSALSLGALCAFMSLHFEVFEGGCKKYFE